MTNYELNETSNPPVCDGVRRLCGCWKALALRGSGAEAHAEKSAQSGTRKPVAALATGAGHRQLALNMARPAAQG